MRDGRKRLMRMHHADALPKQHLCGQMRFFRMTSAMTLAAASV